MNICLVNTNDITIVYVRQVELFCDINGVLITMALKIHTKVRTCDTFFVTDINIQDAVTYKHRRLNL